ncbi:MAG TPA: DUF4383 domain-containing protein [Rubricoccaceae bacterium]|nr:DUF4383 domain-containing protein [Rubricoccaceae bacterium]
MERRANVQTFALVFGALYVLVGILGFVPGLVTPEPAHDMAIDAGHGRLLGLFPVNLAHNLVHLLIGAWGLLAMRSLAGSVNYARGLAVLYGVLAVLGLIPATNTLFGIAPIYGLDVFLHAASALIAGYFGFVDRSGRDARPAV